MEKAVAAALRKLPSVDELMRHATLVQAKERFGRTAVVATVRKVLAEARKSGSFVSNDDFASRVLARLDHIASFIVNANTASRERPKNFA